MTDPGTDPRVPVALAALAEITDPADIGDLVDATEVEPGVVDLHFSTTLPGYVDWRWTVSTAVIDGGQPTVLEVQLLPGAGSLLAPPWVPWTERLAEWRRVHPDEDGEPGADDLDEELDDDDAEPGDEDPLDEDPLEDDALEDDPLEAAGVEAEDAVDGDADGDAGRGGRDEEDLDDASDEDDDDLDDDDDEDLDDEDDDDFDDVPGRGELGG